MLNNLLLLILLTTTANSGGLKLATTTSIDNSGLLNVLLPPFEKMFNIKVDVIAVGTGQALKIAERGDVDVVLVHAPDAELEFVSAGFGIERHTIAWNDFIIIGPANDPAQIKGKNTIKAFQNIAQKKVTFISRGDESGTHKKEVNLWKNAGITPAGRWYLETGQGMGQTLIIADEKNGYCLTDRGTYLFMRQKIKLVIFCEGDKELYNPYSVIAVNPYKHPHTNYVLAMALIGWLTSPHGQKIIANYKKDGKTLFHPIKE
ncbi:MAG: substrate-binding domain-containing protein [Elusimicrobia bacterium]|nr:substrate-binding domain-containing protein [Elusimicrobiota bacterium]